MFRKHWGLRESPFRGALDWRSFFPSPTHEEALARLQFLVDDHRSLGLLLGASGCGKSLVLEVLSRQLRRSGAQVANVSLLGIDLHEFLWLTAADLGICPDRTDSVFSLWRGVLDRLAENRFQQLNTILLLDDAGNTSPHVLDHVARLVQAERVGQAQPRLTVVLAAEAQDAMKLSSRLLELAELRIDVDPWEPGDTVQYVTTALEHAGRTAPLFTDEAMHRLHDLCEGIPRRVKQLANLALAAGAGYKLTEIDASTIDSVFHELAVVHAA